MDPNTKSGCQRDLCVECYDADQDYPCRVSPLTQRNEAIRALRGNLSVNELAERFGLWRRTIWLVSR